MEREKIEVNTGATKQDFTPNVRVDGRLWLAWCFACKRKNFEKAWSTGTCQWCGYKDKQTMELNDE